MNSTMQPRELAHYTSLQLDNFFPDGGKTRSAILGAIDQTMDRIDFCFSRINDKYFNHKDTRCFNHLHGDHYAMYLYFLSNTLLRLGGDESVSAKLFALNKLMHGIDVFYRVELPDIFMFVHPVGTVLGQAKYSNFFTVYQNCNVGSNHDVYPVMDEYFSLHPGASVLGACKIGKNCKIATGSLVMDQDLEDDSLFIGDTLSHRIKKSSGLPVHWDFKKPCKE